MKKFVLLKKSYYLCSSKLIINLINKLKMRNLLKKFSKNQVLVAEPEYSFKNKSTNEIIEEIHESFYSEVDKLLASAKVLNSLDTNKQNLLDKCERLKALGFTNTKEVKEAQEEINRLSALERENKSKKQLTEAINYFSIKYPQYKFITEESVKNICEKYGLVYGEISKYIGTVPDKNLKQMEDFKVSESDECYSHNEYHEYFGKVYNKHYLTLHEYTKNEKDKLQEPHNPYISTENLKCPLEIVAPSKDFNLKDSEIKDFKISKIEIPDPIVLKPVIFGKQKHYLIVTAWGLEASDESVVNEKMN